MGFVTDKGTGSPGGIMVLASAVRDLYDYFKVTQNGCEIRLFPEVSANGEALPIRTGPGLQDITSWINGDHFGLAFLGGGDPSKEKITLLLTIAGDDKIPDRKQRRGIRLWERIRRTFYFHLENGTAPQHWAPWAVDKMGAVMGPKGKSAAKPMLFARGMITGYCTAKGPYRGISRQRPRIRCVLHFPPRAQDALQELVMAKPADAANYHGEDWDKMFTNNAKLVHPETGHLLRFARPGQTETAPTGKVAFGSADDGKKIADDQFQVNGDIVEEAGPIAIPMQYIRAAWEHPWDKLLQIHADEKALVQALEVGIPDDLLIEALRSDPELLTDRLRAKMKKVDEAAKAGTAPTSPQASTQVASASTQPTATTPPSEPVSPVVPAGSAVAFPEDPNTPPFDVDAATGGHEVAIAGKVKENKTSQPNGTAPVGLDAMTQALAEADAAARAGA